MLRYTISNCCFYFLKKIFLFILIFCLTAVAHAQRHLYMDVFSGLTLYKGDLGSIPISKQWNNAVVGAGMAVELSHRLLLRAELNYGRVSGSDKFSIKNKARNLSFGSYITEASLNMEYILFDLYEYKASPYFFAGVGTFKFSPFTNDTHGNRVMLAELSTEGQGFYQNRPEYKLQKLTIPFGGGLQWALNQRIRILLEAGIRKTNTDYLDDVSTTYVDYDLLLTKRGAASVAFAFREDELDANKDYPADGTIRGNPKNKDWYMFGGLHFRFSMQPRLRPYKYTYKPGKAKTSCPTVF